MVLAARIANSGARLELERHPRRGDRLEELERRMERIESAIYALSVTIDPLVSETLA